MLVFSPDIHILSSFCFCLCPFCLWLLRQHNFLTGFPYEVSVKSFDEFISLTQRSRVRTPLSVWVFLWLLIRVCFCVPAVSSGCSQPTGSEWKRPWKTVTSHLAEWDTKILKLYPFFSRLICVSKPSLVCFPFLFPFLSYLYLKALSSSPSIH